MGALLHIGSSDAAVVDSLREEGFDVQSITSDARDHGRFEIVVIDPDVGAPVQVARRIHGDAPDAHIVFLTTPATDTHLRRELLVGRIGTQWSIAPADRPDQAVDAVREAMAWSGRRQKLRTTLTRINHDLTRKSPAPPRRALISNHFLALVLEQMSDAVVVLDPGGTVLAWNAAATVAFGSIRRGASFAETLPAEARDAVEAALDAPAGWADSTYIAPDDEYEYAIRATSLRENGRTVGIALVARDVTMRRKDEKRRELIAEALKVLSSTLDAREAMQKLTDLLVKEVADLAAADILEGDRIVRYAVSATSPEQQRLVDGTRGGEIGRDQRHPSLEALSRGETLVLNDLDEATLASLASSPEHLQALRELGPRSLVISPLRGGSRIIGVLSLARTGDERFSPEEVETIREVALQATSMLQNIWSYRAAADAGRLKDEFLATVSHELRTPMTSILGWAQILRLDDCTKNPELIANGLESIESSARAQAQLIDDLLDLSRMQMGKVQFRARPFSLPGVVRSAVETVRPAAQARNVALLVEAPEDLVISGDPDRMQQVIWNLLSNAVKFSEADRSVKISVTSDRAFARVVVEDQGRGISPDFLPYVFDRFRQAEGAAKRRHGGLGLGLAIVKQLVELHGGTVNASSPGVGRGATLTVTLPLHNAAVAVNKTGPASTPFVLSDLSGFKVLVVEDDPATLAMLEAMLRQAGAEVRTAQSAAAALEALRQAIPDVLLSDVAMPDDDGLSLIRSIRGTLHISPERLPAIAITAFADTGLRVELLGAGFQRFMRKPIEPADLAKAIAEVIRK